MHTPGRPVSSTLGRRHEGSCLLVSRENEFNAGAAKRFDDVEILFARYAKNTIDPLVFQCSN